MRDETKMRHKHSFLFRVCASCLSRIALLTLFSLKSYHSIFIIYSKLFIIVYWVFAYRPLKRQPTPNRTTHRESTRQVTIAVHRPHEQAAVATAHTRDLSHSTQPPKDSIMNLRQKLQVITLLVLALLAFSSYHAGTGGVAWLHWLAMITIFSFLFVFDMAFTNDSNFLFDPDADNWRRKVVG